jgi:hypothetical protein
MPGGTTSLQWAPHFEGNLTDQGVAGTEEIFSGSGIEFLGESAMDKINAINMDNMPWGVVKTIQFSAYSGYNGWESAEWRETNSPMYDPYGPVGGVSLPTGIVATNGSTMPSPNLGWGWTMRCCAS